MIVFVQSGAYESIFRTLKEYNYKLPLAVICHFMYFFHPIFTLNTVFQGLLLFRKFIIFRQYLLKTVKKRFHRDGLNSVEYKVAFINNTKLFTHIMVDVGKPPTEVPNISKMMQ